MLWRCGVAGVAALQTVSARPLGEFFFSSILSQIFSKIVPNDCIRNADTENMNLWGSEFQPYPVHAILCAQSVHEQYSVIRCPNIYVFGIILAFCKSFLVFTREFLGGRGKFFTERN